MSKRLYEEFEPLLGERAKTKPPFIIDHDSGPMVDGLSEAEKEPGDDEDGVQTGDEHLTGMKHRGKKQQRRHTTLLGDSTNAILAAMHEKWEKDIRASEIQDMKDAAMAQRMEAREERLLDIMADMSESLRQMRD